MSRVLVLLGVTCCAVAGWWVLRPMPAAHPDRIAPLFALIDLDGDGAVDPDEARSVGALELDFAALDLDHSGLLSPGEVEASLWALDPAWWVAGPE